eukprot:TRINITY_DN3252_c0_g1_i1.p1 TRINITY_DN3252_c0_g1~~TRINITY_DN3252_c0_g1_i1.p1  ORF type:complete len:828 (+),score=178.95 TRINITY_DN3252_c0_g1_i1:135-2486(+)
MLHDVMRRATTEQQFFTTLFSKLDQLLFKVVPSQSLFIAVDGPASCAKCLTQRQRRRAHLSKDQKSRSHSGAGDLSNNMLTPGVPLMTRLSAALEYYAVSRMSPGKVLAKCEAVTISGALAIGEGEHKIIGQMLRHAGDGGTKASHAIVSGDADLFILSLVQGCVRHVRVVQQIQRQHQQKGQKGCGKRPRGPGGGGGGGLEVWDSGVLVGMLEKELRVGRPLQTAADSSVRRDFALISLFSGNDYLPPLGCPMDNKKLWEKYTSMRRGPFAGQALVIATVQDGLPLSHSEAGWANSVGDFGSAFSVEPYEHYSFNAKFLQALMQFASGGGGGGGGEAEAEGVKSYLIGLLWILEMFHHGYCGDFYYVFEKRHHKGANAGSIARHLLRLQPEGSEPLAPPRSEHAPMVPICCALCILPVQHAEKFICESAPKLKPMLQVDHHLLGETNKMERSTEMHEGKRKAAQLQQRMMELRAAGQDDTAAKAKLSRQLQLNEQMKGGTSDIDVVSLWDVDQEVQGRCRSMSPSLPSLQFAGDTSFLRSSAASVAADGGAEVCALETVSPPARNLGWQPVHCNGISRLDGEWPRCAYEVGHVSEAVCEPDGEADEELAEAAEEPPFDAEWNEHDENVEAEAEESGEAQDAEDVDAGDAPEVPFWDTIDEEEEEVPVEEEEVPVEEEEVPVEDEPPRKRARTDRQTEARPQAAGEENGKNPVSMLLEHTQKLKAWYKSNPVFEFAELGQGTWSSTCWLETTDGHWVSVVAEAQGKQSAKRAASQLMLDGLDV